ncbi:MAG: hypothetical protein ACXWNC_06145 [Anaerolineales bacterium]
MDGFAYLPGAEAEKTGPLDRYLPQATDGIAAAFLAQQFRPGDWVLDPFGASPRTDLEMARLGFKVLVAVNNPVTRFLLETSAKPFTKADLQAALAELSSARKGDERLETHLQSLYLTECSQCRQQVPAEAFIWDRESGVMTGRMYHCTCGDNGEYPATPADLTRAANLAATDSLHRSRALERVTSAGDPDRPHVEEALKCYLPRAVYALITIINKLDGFSPSSEHRNALFALTLTACDEANVLWPHPAERPRPKQLSIPTRFLEKNVWRALESSVETWAGGGQEVEVVNWPKDPGETGGLCLFNGPMRDLAAHLNEIQLKTVVTILPRPNQAFWTLSTLWAGWLWGHEVAATFKSGLHRLRYDWNWHAGALEAALKNLSDRLTLNAPFFAILPEPETSFLSAALLAGAKSGFDLTGLTVRTHHDPVEVLWQRRAFSLAEKEPEKIDTESVRSEMLSTLKERGEPVTVLQLHAGGLAAMAADNSLSGEIENLAQINNPIQEVLAGPGFIHHGESKNPETGLWGLEEWDPEIESLSDRVEVSVVRFLIKTGGETMRALETIINAEFTGLQTPSLGLLRAVLASYAVEANGQLQLREEDLPNSRRADLESTAEALTALGTQMGFSIERKENINRLVLWQDERKTEYAFYLVASAITGKIMRQNQYPPERSILVLPGGRAGLLAYKLERNPDLRMLAEHWRVVKFRALRRLMGIADLSREQFVKEIAGDPIEAPEQMKLF